MPSTKALDVLPPSLFRATHSNATLISLPLELWLEIFSFACFVPGLFDTSDTQAIDAYSSDSNGVVLDNMVAVATRTKCAISRVCRSWWWHIQPLMFEHIRVHSGAHALLVAKRLKGNTEHGPEACRPGRWVKRVEILSMDQYWDEERCDAMVHILDNAPNLVVFSDLFCCSPSSILDHRPLLDRLSERCSNGSLRRLEWYSGSPSSFNGLLHQMRNLEVLIIGRGYISSVLDSQIQLPHLSTIVAGEYANSCRFQDIHCPSLKSLVVHSSVMPHSKFDVRSHFAVEGHVEHMCINFDDWRTNYVVLENFGSLKSLKLDLGRRFMTTSNKQLVHGSLERIEFLNFILFSSSFAFLEQRPHVAWSTLREFMFNLLDRKRLPSLSSIGFYVPDKYFSHGPTTRSQRNFVDFWGPWVDTCMAMNIRVEMSLGVEAQISGVWRTFKVDCVQ